MTFRSALDSFRYVYPKPSRKVGNILQVPMGISSGGAVPPLGHLKRCHKRASLPTWPRAGS
jgi:hypothetical protein